MIKLKREVKVGVFALITLAALYWGINFLKGRDLFHRYNNYYATYDAVNGVQKSSAIMIKGYKIGVVSDMSFDPTNSDKIVVEFNVRSKFRIPENSKARIFSDGLLGGKAIEIEVGDSPRYLEDGDTLRSEMDKGFFEMAGSEVEQIKQKAGKLVDDLTATLNSLNSILSGNADNIANTLDNLAGITGSLRRVVEGEEKTLRDIVGSMNDLATTLNNNSSRIDGIIGNVASFTDSLNSTNIPEVVNNISSAVGELNTALVKINGNEGTLGKLVNDPELYDSLKVASGNLAALLEDLKENPGRYVHFSLFGRKKK